MEIAVRVAFNEGAAVRLLNWLARENERILDARPDLPLIYDSGVVYRREVGEVWSDAINLIMQGHEDCDALAAYRAGELRARGWRALRVGDAGYRAAQQSRPERIRAEVILTTRTRPGRPGLYHCVVRYRIGSRWYRDDPSARLGMRGGRIDTHVRDRWQQLGIEPLATPLEA